MVKRLFVALAIACLLFISCSPNEDDSLLVPVPIFGDGDTSRSSRGLVDMPTDYFENDLWLSGSVMTVMPMMTHLEPSRVSLVGDSIPSGISDYFKTFGFELLLENFCLNRDGVYLRYYVNYTYKDTNKTEPVGFVDYYYNIRTQHFSYRQSVVITFKYDFTEESGTNNMLLNLEYNDIPISKSLTFKVGQLTDSGYLDNNAFIDRFCFGDTLNKMDESGDGFSVFSRSYITANQERNKNGNIMYTFLQPDVVEASTWDYTLTNGNKIKWTDLDYSAMEEVVKRYATGGDNDMLIDTDDERQKTNLDFVYDVIKLMYKNGESIVNHDKNSSEYSGAYRSYDEFLEDSFGDFSSDFKSYYKIITTANSYMAPFMTVYNSNTRKGATTNRFCRGENENPDYTSQKYVNSDVRWGITPEEDGILKYKDDTLYKAKGFADFYGAYNDSSIYGKSSEGYGIEEFLIDKHLQGCGITDTQYIKNFMKIYMDFENTPGDHSNYSMERITNRVTE